MLRGGDVTGDWGDAVFGGAGAAPSAGTEVLGEALAAREADGEDNDGDQDGVG